MVERQAQVPRGLKMPRRPMRPEEHSPQSPQFGHVQWRTPQERMEPRLSNSIDPYRTHSVTWDDDYNDEVGPASSSRGSASTRTSVTAKRKSNIEEHADPAGLKVLHEPSYPPVADLVFVHAPGGGSVRTWTDQGRKDTFWPYNWLPTEASLRSTRICTYGYSSDLSLLEPDRLLDLPDLAKDLLAKLRFGTNVEGRPLNIGQVPIIFLAHSLGGLVAKKAYLLAMSDSNSAYGEIARATATFVFFSCPHRGLKTSLLHAILSSCVDGWRQDRQPDVLSTHLPRLQDINEKFRDLANSLEIYSFYERPSMSHPGLPTQLSLPQHVATLDHPRETQIPLRADHVSITKYQSRLDENFASVKGAIITLVDRASDAMSRRRSTLAEGEDSAAQMADVKRLLLNSDPPIDDFEFFSDKRIDGSCEWVLDHPIMDAFLSDTRPSPQALWCSAKVGSGKSVTATFLIENLIDNNRPCAYYYFRSGNQAKNSLGHFLLSLAMQVAQLVPEYRRRLCTLAADRFDTGKAGYKLLWKRLFVLTLLKCNLRASFYVVLDGLDELGQAKDLLQKLLVDLEGASIPLRVLLVSRGTLEIEHSIERLSKRIPLQKMSLDGNEDDLALYVQEEMGGMVGSNNFKERTIQSLLAKAGGNFLWAHLVVQEISKCQTEDQVEDALRQVPRGLEPLYERMDTSLADMFQSRPQDKLMGHMIMMWASCARRPLLLEEIQTALEFEFPRILDIEQTVQRLCGEFVLVDKRGHVIMMHASAREYLMDNTNMNYHVDASSANHLLFSRCIQVLTVEKRGHQQQATAKTFLHYAASSWSFHLGQTAGHSFQTSLTVLHSLFTRRTVLDWIYIIAQANELRVLILASKTLRKLLKNVDEQDRDRNPLMHQLAVKETLALWTQDLVRIVGKYGPQITQHPKTIYNLLPAFCPKESILHKQFAQIDPEQGTRMSGQLSLRGKTSPNWDDCFAKFTVLGDSLPTSVVSLERYFAVLTKDSGIIHLYYASTCDLARRLSHGELVIALCVDSTETRIASYGSKRTVIWEVESGRALFNIENPAHARALSMSFSQHSNSEDGLVTFSDDRVVRSCSLNTMRFEWQPQGGKLQNSASNSHEVNAPRHAKFSAGGTYLAVSYRGAYPEVWSLEGPVPEFVRYCDHRSRSSIGVQHGQSKILYVSSFSWSSLTGHLIGTYSDGFVFKWHPWDGDFELSHHTCETIKCATDGKLFATSSGDGTLRVWDLEHFTPIYQQRYPGQIRDLDIAGARVYDIRAQYCNLWEPNSLFRAMESDEQASDSLSSKESEQPSLISENLREDFEPIVAFTLRDESVFGVGNDAGLITISDLDGSTLLEIENGFMGIEDLAWCGYSNSIISVDLSREIKVWACTQGESEDDPWTEHTLVRCFSEPDEIVQILPSAKGDAILLVTPMALKIYKVHDTDHLTVIPTVFNSKWSLHPTDCDLAVGFSTEKATIISWTNPGDMVIIPYSRLQVPVDQAPSSPINANARRPSQAYPASPSEIQSRVRRVFVSPDAKLILVEIFHATKQSKHRSSILLIETQQLTAGWSAQLVACLPLPESLLDNWYASLGFVRANLGVGGHGRPHLSRQGSEHRNDTHTFVFVDRSFWVSSVDLSASLGPTSQIRKHFFLPRDWQNAEWLDMATVTASGDFLCPRNGDVAVVSNGLLDQYAEDAEIPVR